VGSVAEQHARGVAPLANLGVRVDGRGAQEGVAEAVERGGEGIGDVTQGRGGESHDGTRNANCSGSSPRDSSAAAATATASRNTSPQRAFD